MKKRGAGRRIAVPVSIVLGTMIVSSLAYDAMGSIESRPLKQAVLWISVAGLFVSVWIGPLIANTLAYFRGASQAERFLVSFAVPAVWVAKTYWYFVGIYSAGELAYLILHPVIFGNLGVNLLCMGISEVLCRGAHGKKESVRALTPATVSILAAGLAVTFLGLWNGGHTYYYYYMDLYTLLFID